MSILFALIYRLKNNSYQNCSKIFCIDSFITEIYMEKELE